MDKILQGLWMGPKGSVEESYLACMVQALNLHIIVYKLQCPQLWNDARHILHPKS